MVLSLHEARCHVVTIVFIVRTVPLKKLMKHICDYKSIHIHIHNRNLAQVEEYQIQNHDIWVFLKLNPLNGAERFSLIRHTFV